MRLLVVEDEEALAGYLRRGLEEASWAVDVSGDAADAWRRLLLDTYDLVVLDLGLPGEDSIRLLRQCNRAASTCRC